MLWLQMIDFTIDAFKAGLIISGCYYVALMTSDSSVLVPRMKQTFSLKETLYLCLKYFMLTDQPTECKRSASLRDTSP